MCRYIHNLRGANLRGVWGPSSRHLTFIRESGQRRPGSGPAEMLSNYLDTDDLDDVTCGH